MMEYRVLQGVHFLKLQGDFTERARAHIQYAQQPSDREAFVALAKKNEWLIRRAPGWLRYQLVQEIVLTGYRACLVPRLIKNCTSAEREALRIFAKEWGYSMSFCAEALLQPDLLMLLAKWSVIRHLLPEWVPSGMPSCTSAVTLKSWTAQGRLLACRNLDYMIVGPWEKNPTLLFQEPSESGEIPYVSCTSLGIHSGGLTSMNREGLTLFTHAHFGKEVSIEGRPIVLLGDEVIRTSKTLGQAIDRIRKAPRSSNWAFVISSALENEAIVVEMTPSQTRVRSTEDGFLAHSNYFHHPDLQKQEALLCGSYCEDLEGRFCRIRQLLEDHRTSILPTHMMQALGDHVDFFSGQERILGNTVGVVTTLQSIVCEPETQTLWMATRPESPVGLGDYLQIPLERFWTHPLHEQEADLPVMSGYRPKTPGLVEAARCYREAYIWYHMKNQEPEYLQQTWHSLQKAVSLFPSDGHLWLQAGLIAFQLHAFSEAQAYFEGSRACILSQHVSTVRDLFLARCFDLLGQRSSALELYQSHPEIQEPKLRQAYRAGLKRPFRKKEIAHMLLDLQFADAFHY